MKRLLLLSALFINSGLIALKVKKPKPQEKVQQIDTQRYQQLMMMQEKINVVIQELIIDFRVDFYDWMQSLVTVYFDDVEKYDAEIEKNVEQFLAKNIDAVVEGAVIIFEDTMGQTLNLAEKEQYCAQVRMGVSVTTLQQIKNGVAIQATIYKRAQEKKAA